MSGEVPESGTDAETEAETVAETVPETVAEAGADAEPVEQSGAASDSGDEQTDGQSNAATADDLEGPRRRARREREERRAAQQRATAIENARREAKRRVTDHAATAQARLGERTVKGLKLLVWLIVLTVASVVLGCFTNFLNNVADTELDIPRAEPVPAHASCSSGASAVH